MFSRLLDFWSSRNFVLNVLVLQFVFLAVVFLDVPIARQIFVFLFLMFVPGIVFLRLLKLKNLHSLEMILFSAGFSIAFLMIVGLLINELGLIVGISNPLSEISLLITLNSVLLVLTFLSSSGIQEQKRQVAESLRSIAHSPLAVLFLLLPFLSVIGTIWLNAYENNSILLFMIIAISFLFITGYLSRKLLPPKLYPLVVLTIAISLLFHFSLVSNKVQSSGSDSWLEFTVFRITQKNEWWNARAPALEIASTTPLARFSSMLSITVLPTILSNLMNMDATWVLKILYPLFFSFVPLALYHLWQTRLGTRIALISVFLFMSQETFYTEMLGLNRQMVAELFFVLILIVLLKSKMQSSKKITCFTIFSLCFIASHYGMAIIFISLLFFAWIYLVAVGRWRTNVSRITLSMVILFSVLMFSWYIYTSGSATFDSILQFGNYVRDQMGQWANPASRGTAVLRGLGMVAPHSIWNAISRAFAYFVQFLIVIGFVGLILGLGQTRLGREYFIFTSLSMFILVALIVVPGLAKTLNMARFYHILLFFLAPLAALGARNLINLVFKRKKQLKISILLLAVVIPYFLFQTNFIYEMVGSDSWSIPLSKYRMDSLQLYGNYRYIDEQSAFGARWLSENVDIKYTPIYADIPARSSILTYYGITYEGNVKVLSNATSVATNGTIYLNRLNVVYGTIVGGRLKWNFSEFSPILESMNKIYSNGASEIYKNGFASTSGT